MTPDEKAEPKLLPAGSRVFGTDNLVSSGYTPTCIFPIEFDGRTFNPTSGKSWKTNQHGIEALRRADRLSASGKTLRYLTFADDYPVMKLSNVWTDTKGESDKSYAVQTSTKIVERCLFMTTDPGDLVFDPTCGSGTTAFVAEKWGRRWVTCDTSRVALTLAKQRLMTAQYDYYELAQPSESRLATYSDALGNTRGRDPHLELGKAFCKFVGSSRSAVTSFIAIAMFSATVAGVQGFLDRMEVKEE